MTSPLKPLNGIKRNLTESNISTPSTKFVFFEPIGKQDGRPSLWLAWDIFYFFSEPLNGIQRNLTGSKISTPLPSLCFSVRSEKQDGRPGLWLAETFSTSPLNGIQWNLTGSKISKPSTKFCVFRADRKNKMAAWPLIGRDIFDFSSETTERNSAKLDRKQALNAFYQVCVIQVDRKNKMAALAYDLLRHFQLFLWNHWIEFNKTWQGARS